MLQNQVCFRTMHLPQPWSLQAYESVGGYQMWRKILTEKISPALILDQIKASGLRGRGGAGFPTATKLGFIKRDAPGQKYIVCNSDEGEPGTFKDRDIMRYNPHQIIEGIAIAGYVMGASVGFNYIRGEFTEPIIRMEAALAEANKAGYLGNNVFKSGYDFVMHNVFGAGAYICGEETALMDSIEGKKGMPRFKPPFPATHGVYGKPTTVNNTETLASLPVILQHGGTHGNFKIFSVSGHVAKPGNYEIALGTPFKELLKLAGGMLDGKKLKAVIPGGSSAPVLPSAMIMDLPLDYDPLAKAGSMLGSGGVIVLDQNTCMVSVCARIADFYMEESCGKCTPCREGTGWLARMVRRILNGQGTHADLDKLDQVAGNIMGHTICALGDAAGMAVHGFVRHFREEFVAKI